MIAENALWLSVKSVLVSVTNCEQPCCDYECLPQVGYAVHKFLMWDILEGYTGLNTRNNLLNFWLIYTIFKNKQNSEGELLTWNKYVD